MPRKDVRNVVHNWCFERYPLMASPVDTTNNQRVIDGTASGGIYSQPNPNFYTRHFVWISTTYNTTNAKMGYDFNNKMPGFGAACSMHLSGQNVMERVEAHLGERNYNDLNDPIDISQNCIPLLPSTDYLLRIRYRTNITAVTGNPFSAALSMGSQVNFYEHTPTGATQNTRVRLVKSSADLAVLPLDTGWITQEQKITTRSDTAFMNIIMQMAGNSTDNWSGDMWIQSVEVLQLSKVRSLATR